MLKCLMSTRIFLSQFSSPSSCSVGHISGFSDLESEISSIDEGTVHNPLAATLSWAKWRLCDSIKCSDQFSQKLAGPSDYTPVKSWVVQVRKRIVYTRKRKESAVLIPLGLLLLQFMILLKCRISRLTTFEYRTFFWISVMFSTFCILKNVLEFSQYFFIKIIFLIFGCSFFLEIRYIFYLRWFFNDLFFFQRIRYQILFCLAHKDE